MKGKIGCLVLWAVVYGGSLAANLGSFWMGDGAAAGQLAVTCLYGAACFLLLWTARSSRRWMKILLIWGVVSVAAGVFCLLARAGIAWSVIPALLLGGGLFTPLYGLTYLEILEDWDVFYGVMLTAGAVWTLLCGGWLWKRNHEK